MATEGKYVATVTAAPLPLALVNDEGVEVAVQDWGPEFTQVSRELHTGPPTELSEAIGWYNITNAEDVWGGGLNAK